MNRRQMFLQSANAALASAFGSTWLGSLLGCGPQTKTTASAGGDVQTRTATQTAPAAGDPLSSWNDGPAKEAVLDFVKKTTDKASPHFVPLVDRLAEFDQDGTLWVEHPVYTQVVLLPRSCWSPRQRKT